MTIVEKQKTGNKRQQMDWHWVGKERWIHAGTRRQNERNPESKVQKIPPAKQHLHSISWEQGKFPKRTSDRLHN